MATLTTTAALSMKLFIDTKSQRVLFAEAGKDVVDFLYSLMGLPLATVVSLVWGPGSAGSLYHSANLEARSSLYHSADLEPRLRAMDSSPSVASLFFMPASSFEPSRTFFRCKSNNAARSIGIRLKACNLYMTDVEGTRCPNCCEPMTAKLQHVSSVKAAACLSSSPAAGALMPAPSRLEPSMIFFSCELRYTSGINVRGCCDMYMADVKGTACPNCDHRMMETLYYVSPAWPNPNGRGGLSMQDQEAAATYTVHDYLSITQNNPASAISKDPGAVEERTVPLTYRKGLEILSTMLHSETVLTDVFICKVRA